MEMKDTRRYILIAEDSRTQADLLCYILNGAGYETEVAETGVDALVSIKKRLPDLLLTDIVMPGMDGYELCTAVREDPAIAHLPVILVTQLYDPEDVIRGLSCGANNFIIKPYDPDGLLAGIESVLHPQEPPDEMDGTTRVEYKKSLYLIRSGKEDILNILLSIYETAVTKNIELEQATDRLNVLTGSLEELVIDRTTALQRTTDTVEQLLMQKNELITKIGHDLKTPLTPLVALLPHVLKHEQDSELKEILDVLVNDVHTLKGLVEQILKLSHLNQESFSMTMADISLSRVIQEVVGGYTFSIRQLNLVVHNYIPLEYTAHISPFHITTIFDNLISNAIKYNIRGGTITCRVFDEGEFWSVTIADSGIGLSPEESCRVFEEFYKADPSRHDRSSHGLGLSIVQRIVSLYEGSISVSSQGKGMGTTFQVRLPKAVNNSGARKKKTEN